MSATELYNTYLFFAEEADHLLKFFEQFTNEKNQISQLDCRYIHKNIKFVYKKLISLLSNKDVWDKFSRPCNVYGYNASINNEINLNAELEFLVQNREDIIKQLSCIINTTIFEIDLKFLDSCVKKLQQASDKIKLKASDTTQQFTPRYSIAS